MRILEDAEVWVVLRSNGPHELAHPGAGRSAVLASTAHAAVRDSIARETSERQWPILQTAVEPALLGVMSNERRYCRDGKVWVVEGPISLRGPEFRQLEAVDHGPVEDALIAESSEQIVNALARVGGYLCTHYGNRRVRCEWAWDGGRVWILQADPQPEPRRGVADTWLAQPASSARLPLGDPPSSMVGWAKADSLRMLSGLGLPTVSTAAITAAQWRAGAFGDLIAAVGLDASPQRPLSVRTDSLRPGRQFLMPTSSACAEREQLDRFMIRAAKTLEKAGVAEDEWGFLIAPWVDARAGAWVHARPGDAHVEIHAAWGHPDGLMALPHDRFTIDLERGRVVEDVMHKPMLLRGDREKWHYESLGPRWDWESSLTAAEALRAAEWCRRVADHLDTHTQLLVLAAVNGIRSPETMLPLFHVPVEETAAETTLPAALATVSSASDVRALPPDTTAVMLRVSAHQLRDAELLKDIAAACHNADLPILVPGSHLGHTLYVLREVGANAIWMSPSATPEPVDSRGWVTCLIRSEHTISRILAIRQEHAASFACMELRTAELANDRLASVRAQCALELIERSSSGGPAPTRMCDLPVLEDRAGAWTQLREHDLPGQPLAHLA